MELPKLLPANSRPAEVLGVGAKQQLPRVLRLTEETEAHMNSRPLHRTATSIAVLALAAGATLSLTGCVGHATQSPATPPASASPTRGAEGILQVVHTPRIVVDDEWISPNGCHAVYVYSFLGQVRPDNRCTPGAADPAVTQSNIAETICLPGYAASVTPPAAVLAPYFLRALKDYGMSPAPTIQFDYLIRSAWAVHPQRRTYGPNRALPLPPTAATLRTSLRANSTQPCVPVRSPSRPQFKRLTPTGKTRKRTSTSRSPPDRTTDEHAKPHHERAASRPDH